ncbi:MAG: RdgB/HAM1 family non-canonical purine NTP pyrophosphatase [Clostridia bacterium]|nr:RdgB/HAM1 family non-canonical purine NTP pyrophosphatase [Clostridia bacterium]
MDKKILVLASGNKGKIREISNMLPNFIVKGYKEFGLDFEIEENGATYYENAFIKAKTVSKILNLPVLADDSGLSVDYLNGEPGVYSARYAGDGDDEHNNDKLLKNLEGITDRKAKFICCMVYYVSEEENYSVTGETSGEILYKREGKSGFGYDPIFYSYDLNKSLGVATDEEKNSISHRSRALKEIVKFIK